MLRFAPAFLSAILFASSASAAPLWQASESGMSVAQVAAAFPAAEPQSNPSTLYGGARCELKIAVYSVGASRFSVCFYFVETRLKQVTLTAAEPTEALFDSSVDLLRSKYGSELGAGTPACKRGLLTACKADWALPTGANVSVVYMTIGGKEPVLNINYQTRMADEASKL